MTLTRASVALVLGTLACGGVALEPWHEVGLNEEFTAAKAKEVQSFADYRELEERLFVELDEEVYARVEVGPQQDLVRYSPGSSADPRDDEPDWNRSFELVPEEARGGVLLLHGMSDSPYSLRALALTLKANGYRVLGLRMPGHGTAPSGLTRLRARDLSAATRLGVRHLAGAIGESPLHIVGYSTGAPLAVEYALDASEGKITPRPASLVLVSPAIRIHASARLARFKNFLSVLPGLGGLAWFTIHPEFDPYKYNSFATNAADVVHRLSRDVDRRIAARAPSKPETALPPILVFKSTVDSTVTTAAVVDRLLMLLEPRRHELVLFDVNRSAGLSSLLVSDPGPFTRRLVGETLPFHLTLITNASAESDEVVALHKEAFSSRLSPAEKLSLRWPTGVVSLSHVSVAIPPHDPLYGRREAHQDGVLFLGEMAMQGERGLLRLPAEWLLRMRYNPFYEVFERRALAWVIGPGS